MDRIDANEDESQFKQGKIHDLTSLAKDLGKLLNDEKYVDINLMVSNNTQEKIFKAHKSILASRTSYFEALFYGNFRESYQTEIFITGMDPNIFALILKWIYTSSIIVSADNIKQVNQAATRFNLPELAEQCETFTGDEILTRENILEFLGESFGVNNHLTEKCLQFVDYHAKHLLPLTEFVDIPFEVVDAILKRDSLDLDEEQVFFVGDNIIQPCSGVTGDGLYEGIDWITGVVRFSGFAETFQKQF